jgi:hypothetical protein
MRLTCGFDGTFSGTTEILRDIPRRCIMLIARDSDLLCILVVAGSDGIAYDVSARLRWADSGHLDGSFYFRSSQITERESLSFAIFRYDNELVCILFKCLLCSLELQKASGAKEGKLYAPPFLPLHPSSRNASAQM